MVKKKKASCLKHKNCSNILRLYFVSKIGLFRSIISICVDKPKIVNRFF